MASGNDAVEEPLDNRKFKVLLNGVQDLQLQLEEFKKACDAHEKHRRRRPKRRYYHLGLMARIVSQTTEDELRRLLRNGTRTFLIDMVANKPNELQQIVSRTRNSIEEYQQEEFSSCLVTGIALEIHGDCCRVGRLRNNCSVLLQRGQVITFTTDESYRYSCFREISFVLNLKYYISSLKIQDQIFIGRSIHGKVVKRLKDNIAVLIDQPGVLNSYEYIELPNQCYSLKQEVFQDLFIDDLSTAADLRADYIVVPRIRCKPFLRTLQNRAKENFKLIGAIDLEFVSSKMLDLMGIIKALDYLWIPDMYTSSASIRNYINEDVIPLAKCLKKPIIGSVPLERCSDFKRFENNEFLWKIDTIFIEKSPWCNKYPLIVKKLLPIKDFRIGVVQNCMTMKNILTSYDSVINFIIRTISSIECQAIFLYSKCETAAVALARVEIYCPVFVLLPLTGDEEDDCRLHLARASNMRRNLRPITYSKDMNDCNYKPIEYGIDYTRRNGCLDTGDFIITLEVGKEDNENIEYGLDQDVVILRAFYLPPLKFSEKFKCS